jgi:hypothetical protein
MNIDINNALILGDVHADVSFITIAVEKAIEHDLEAVIVVGDFGYWPEAYFVHRAIKGYPYIYDRDYFESNPEFALKDDLEVIPSVTALEYDIPVYFIDGNHEFFGVEGKPGLSQFTEITEINKNLFYVPRGIVERIANTTVAFVGGAASLDRNPEKLGIHWYEEETITFNDVRTILDYPNDIDVVLSHDIPISYSPPEVRFVLPHAIPGREELEKILTNKCPNHWYSGHYHVNDVKYDRRCNTLFRILASNKNIYDDEPVFGIHFDFVKNQEIKEIRVNKQ